MEVEDPSAKLVENPKIDIQQEFQKVVANVINQMMFGYRFVGVCTYFSFENQKESLSG